MSASFWQYGWRHLYLVGVYVPPRVMQSSQSGQNVCFIVSRYSPRFGSSSGGQHKQKYKYNSQNVIA